MILARNLSQIFFFIPKISLLRFSLKKKKKKKSHVPYKSNQKGMISWEQKKLISSILGAKKLPIFSKHVAPFKKPMKNRKFFLTLKTQFYNEFKIVLE